MTPAAPGTDGALDRSPLVVVSAILAALALSVVADLLVGASPPGLMAVFGLGATALLVLVSKGVVAPALKRPIGSRPGDEIPAGPDEAAIAGPVPSRTHDA